LAKAKFWREFDVRPIANSEWMAAMMRRSPLFEGMEIPVVPPIVDDIFFSITKDTNFHEFGEPLITLIDTDEGREAGHCLAGQAGAEFSNPSTSERGDFLSGGGE
jgi:hypothetical protein